MGLSRRRENGTGLVGSPWSPDNSCPLPKTATVRSAPNNHPVTRAPAELHNSSSVQAGHRPATRASSHIHKFSGQTTHYNRYTSLDVILHRPIPVSRLAKWPSSASRSAKRLSQRCEMPSSASTNSQMTCLSRRRRTRYVLWHFRPGRAAVCRGTDRLRSSYSRLSTRPSRRMRASRLRRRGSARGTRLRGMPSTRRGITARCTSGYVRPPWDWHGKGLY